MLLRKRKANPVSLKNVLRPTVKDIGIESKIFFEELKKNWEHIVGKTNAKNTRPLSLADGVLTIAVFSPVWVTQTRFYKSTFIEKINSFDNLNDYTIHEIHFKLDKS
jgi:predicted nucleic acid-binding Zn ribbon protein